MVDGRDHDLVMENSKDADIVLGLSKDRHFKLLKVRSDILELMIVYLSGSI